MPFFKFISIISFCLTSVVVTGSPATAATPRPLATPAHWRTSGGRYPDRLDVTRLLTYSQQSTFQCIRYHESRNHLVDGSLSQGWYQFTQPIWAFARQAIRGLPATPNQASGDQQSSVAVFYFKRNGRFGVEWAAEAGLCPGRF